VAETCGGLATNAVELLDVISSAAAEHLSLWSRQDAPKVLLDSVSTAPYRGTETAVSHKQIEGDVEHSLYQ
jgi:hypothetical protein